MDLTKLEAKVDSHFNDHVDVVCGVPGAYPEFQKSMSKFHKRS